MTEVIPAILPKRFDEISANLGLIVGATTYAQIDVCDGKLTPEATWPHTGKGYLDFQKLVNQEIGLPHWEDFNFEIDLMITGTTDELLLAINDWGMAGASRVIIHPVIHRQFLRSSEDLKKIFAEARLNNMEAGLAIHIDTPVEQFKDVILDADVIQCMGIEKIGYQGEKMSEKVFDQIKKVLEIKPEAIISVDGGVNMDTAADLVDAGVTRLVAGSAIFTNGSPRDVVNYLQEL